MKTYKANTLDDKHTATVGEDHLELKKLECEPIRAMSTSQAVGPPTTSNTTTVGSPHPTTTTTITSTKTTTATTGPPTHRFGLLLFEDSDVSQ